MWSDSATPWLEFTRITIVPVCSTLLLSGENLRNIRNTWPRPGRGGIGLRHIASSFSVVRWLSRRNNNR